MKKLIIFIISIYRRYLSSLMRPACRYIPTCSEYTIEAIRKQGLRRGLFSGLRRICRCHPFSRRRIYDPASWR